MKNLARAVEIGEGVVSPERFRLMSLFLAPVSRLGFLEKISREHGVVSVIDPFFTCWGEGRLDSTSPLENLARKIYMAPEMAWCSPWDEKALKKITDCAEQYKADGAVYYAHIGCGHSCAMIKLVKDALNEVDVPMLILDCDVIDPRFTSKAEIREKLEQFFELLEDR
ncbi:MAG: 2-hydroxyacyl-CoA dehydratase [Dehalococcoidia bacterium]|nr:2-hydroxyacyl-CoA dehydratase [Dehalococcoidia bacterium]